MKDFRSTSEYIDINNLLRNIAETGEVPERFPEYFYSEIGTPYYQLHHWFTLNCSWCLISWEWLKLLNDNIIKGGRCLEICAGHGLLSHSLQTLGVNIIATDDYSWIEAKEMRPHYYTDVIMKKAVPAIRNFSERDGLDFVLVSWPAYQNPDIENCLLTMRTYAPNAKLIYIGEALGGRTATPKFFEMAHECEEYNEHVGIINRFYPRWPSLKDELKIYN